MTGLATDSGRKTPARLAGSAVLACQSDERLVKLVRAGQERAFDAIVQRYRKPLVRYCARILPESRCEDAVQQAFINAHAGLVSSDDALQLRAWLYAIARNAALNMLRQNGWSYEQIPLDFDGVRRPDQVLEQRIELQQTVDAMNDLPERQRSALVMRELEGRSYDEIALALGANDGAVRQLLNRARVTLRNAASLLLPPPLVARAAASLPPSDGRRIGEIAGGLGAAGMAKAGATALVAGSLVVGVVKAPLPLGDSHQPTRQKATLAPDKTVASTSAHDVPAAFHKPVPAAQPQHSSAPGRRAARGDNRRRSGSGRSGSGRSGATERREPAEREHSGRTTTPERSGGGDDSSGSQRSGSGDRSGSDDRSGSGSGGGGSDDVVAAPIQPDDHSGSSGTSGDSGSSGSGSSDSGSSGSGSSGSGSSGSGSSGSDDLTVSSVSGESGSGGSGSGTSGSGSSGSDDPLHH
jgi:RNA polymerase sigma factor (sigma-70 family)